MRKTFAAILAITGVLWFSTVQTRETKQYNENTVSYSSLNKKTQAQVECLAQNVYFEAGYEKPQGQMAVALVTLNRAEANGNPQNICGVVKERTETVCQFTWWCDASLRDKAIHQRFTPREKEVYNQVKKVALYTYLNYENIVDVTKGAMFYHATYVNPRWKYKKTVQIGNHIFYRKA